MCAQSDQSSLCAKLDPSNFHADIEDSDTQADLIFAGRRCHFVVFCNALAQIAVTNEIQLSRGTTTNQQTNKNYYRGTALERSAEKLEKLDDFSSLLDTNLALKLDELQITRFCSFRVTFYALSVKQHS